MMTIIHTLERPYITGRPTLPEMVGQRTFIATTPHHETSENGGAQRILREIPPSSLLHQKIISPIAQMHRLRLHAAKIQKAFEIRLKQIPITTLYFFLRPVPTRGKTSGRNGRQNNSLAKKTHGVPARLPIAPRQSPRCRDRPPAYDAPQAAKHPPPHMPYPTSAIRRETATRRFPFHNIMQDLTDPPIKTTSRKTKFTSHPPGGAPTAS